MLKTVGFDRSIKRIWLDKTADLLILGEDKRTIRNNLDNCLREQRAGKESRRKIINLLMRSWVNVAGEYKSIQERALKLYIKGNKGERLVLHWCMVAMAYGLFFDISEVLGGLFSIQDEVTLGLIRSKIYASWGERSTLYYAINRVIASMRDWGIIRSNGKTGGYIKGDVIKIDCKATQLFLLEVYLIISQRMNIPCSELEMITALFPFGFNVALHDIQGNERFRLDNMGMELVISIR